MTMLDFDIPLRSGAAPTASQVTAQVTVSTTVEESIRVVPADARGFLGKPPLEWNWSDLRDYIITEVERRHGPQIRDAKKESGIIKGFISRWGIEQAVGIAQAAFKVHDGMWRNAPITITRFTKGSDPYFAQIIADSL